LQGKTPDIEASAVVSVDGLIMASSLPAGVEEDRVSAMSAATEAGIACVGFLPSRSKR
jgi:predicted regulator of Ras-like GTPase activity (Roadblock/LC7/MglB family)